jgi:hypothetical protein
MEPTKITDEYLELDPTKLLEHMETYFENPTPKVQEFLKCLRDNPKGTVRVKAVGEERFITQQVCDVCEGERLILGADCPYCTEGV